MDPRHLLQALLARDNETPTSLARKLQNATTQPQIHKFLRGQSKEPRRATLQPVASHFNVPLDAFYDSDVALEVAKGLGLKDGPSEVKEPLPASKPVALIATGKWPFKLVTYRRFEALPPEARRDIDATLDVLVEKWERLGKPGARKR